MGEAREMSATGSIIQYWAVRPGGVKVSEEFSRAYFDRLEAKRYLDEPEVHAFAQFPRAHGLKVLEVGVGSGTDFLQWVRSGAEAYGVDMTEAAIQMTRRRLAEYGLSARDLRLASAEALPYADDTFDLVYSWGVIHHVQHPDIALGEIIRVIKPGGLGKIMVYHRHSVVAFQLWLWYGLLRGRPWKSLRWAVENHMESPGTQSYTKQEMRRKLSGYPLGNIRVNTVHTVYDDLTGIWPIKWLPSPWPLMSRLIARLVGWNETGWFMLVEFEKKQE